MGIRPIIRRTRVRACLAILLLSSQLALGDTTITGTQSVAVDNGLGAGLITLDGGTLSFDANGIDLDNDFLVDTTGGTLVGADVGAATGVQFLHGDFTLDGDLLLDGHDSFVIIGAVSGSSRLTIDMDGYVLALAGDASHTGGTLVSAGTLQIGAGLATGSVSGDIDNNGRVEFLRPDDVSYDGVISGTGSVRKQGSNTLTLTGNNTYSGDTDIQDGVLVFTGSTAGLGGDILNESELVFHQDQESSFAGDISGNGGVTKAGPGTLTLTGSSTYTGPTIVSNGTLMVNGSLLSEVDVRPSGTLSGSGSVGAVSVIMGEIAPGDDGIGTLTVNGDLDMQFGIYRAELGPSNADLLQVTGNATLSNSRLWLTSPGGNYTPSNEYLLLSADGGIVGEFIVVSFDLNLAFLVPELRYETNGVYLTLTPNGVAFASVAETPNQRAVAEELDAIGTAPDNDFLFVMNELEVLTAEEARRALDELSGVQHVHGLYVARQALRGLQRLSFGRLGGGGRNPGLSGLTLAFSDQPWAQQMESQWLAMLDDAGEQIQNRGLWARGYGVFGDIDADANAVGAHYDTAGLALGLDADFGEHWMAGVAGGYAGTETDSPEGELDGDTFQLSGYAGYQRDQWYAHGFVGYAWHDVDSTRTFSFGIPFLVSASYDMSTFSAALEVGYDFAFSADTALTPFATLDYARSHRESFTEFGPGGLDVDGETAYSLRPTFGLRLSHTLTADNGSKFEPVLYAAYAREVMDNVTRVQATFAEAPADGFLIDGPETDRSRFLAGAALNTALTQRALLSFAWDAELAGSDTAHALSATFRYRW